MDWKQLIDASYCISLRCREDRYENVCKELKAVGLHDITHYLRPEKHKLGGHVGCWTSHRTIMQMAYDEGQRYVLILEDDVKFLPSLNAEILHSGIKYFKSLSQSADILYLGHVPMKLMHETACPHIYETQSLGGHAYIINTHGRLCQLMLHMTCPDPPLDGFFMKHAKSFAVFPMIAIQEDRGSSNIQIEKSLTYILQYLWPLVPVLEHIMVPKQAFQYAALLVFLISCSIICSM
jgi:GR25 family glycosyltransferase involved in LPS biosynthesis